MTAGAHARAREILDLQEARGPVELLDDAGIERLLRTSRRIAIVGASPRPGRPSNDVLGYLMRHGYECVPIRPGVDEILGLTAYPTLAAAVEATGPFDIVDVFRRSELCGPHAEEAVAAGARSLWLQQGVVNWEAARIASDGSVAVVMDRCTAIEHHRLLRG
jgi:hypothetical protein